VERNEGLAGVARALVDAVPLKAVALEAASLAGPGSVAVLIGGGRELRPLLR